MAYSSKIVLSLPVSAPDVLPKFVEECLRDGVELICIAGIDSDQVEDQIDWLIVGDGSDDTRFIVTTSHGDEPLGDVVQFATTWAGDGAVGEAAQLVRL
jgi:hypothetical protein